MQNAAEMGHFEIAKYLLKHGAYPTIKDQYGERPYTEAVYRRYSPIEKINTSASKDPLIRVFFVFTYHEYRNY
ncbi:hypothetical protein [Brevibacillus laterosporus]|uniref:hypothetical protein n=1 Tax=Brevibacillus laterosporus TaxID=1465 RepID=UPI0024064A62|nr:hypothetical protein [Brevibacillus laterosporus]